MQLKSRFIALPLAAVLASGTLFSSAPAEAAPKSKLYKGGAIALGALGAYMLSKGKTVEGAAILGGGYLAYKQGEKARKNEKYDDRYGRYDGRSDNGRDNGYYGNGAYNNGSYNQPYYNGNAAYNNGNDYRYNDGDGDRDCREEGQGRGHGKGQHHSNGRSWQR